MCEKRWIGETLALTSRSFYQHEKSGETNFHTYFWTLVILPSTLDILFSTLDILFSTLDILPSTLDPRQKPTLHARWQVWGFVCMRTNPHTCVQALTPAILHAKVGTCWVFDVIPLDPSLKIVSWPVFELSNGGKRITKIAVKIIRLPVRILIWNLAR